MDLAELNELAEAERQARSVIRSAAARRRLSSDGQAVRRLVRAVAEARLTDRVHVASVGCMRLCCEGPLVQVDPDGPLYEKVTPGDAPSIVAALNGGTATARQSRPPVLHPPAERGAGEQRPGRAGADRVVHRPGRLRGGSRQVLREMRPQEVIDEITRSGLRGRGGS
ncbi:MAG: hypothetical protein U0736_28470 [Gemmataceae bacterium]